MQIFLCDDNSMILSELKNLITDYFKDHTTLLPTITEFNNGEALLNSSIIPDITFLDIEMPGVNGIFVGEELKKRNKNSLIFIVTSYDKYLDDAMRFNVFRYLSKPIAKDRLYKNLNDALKLISSYEEPFILETRHNNIKLLKSDIICAEAVSRNTIIHTIHGDYEVAKGFKYYTEFLTNDYFYRSHRSFIVNMNYISTFNKSNISLYNGKISAYLTVKKYSDFKNVYMKFLENNN